ncbi:ABC transporter permease [Sporosarcina sp. Marseille-Q4063]|uniref:ABC transporter permease n=1 Tax=Sporosarcina sp. Marseille-Q4063 TaxID=2810514 RepID=UPI001BB0B0C0|nr:ABC transporter permease [Sporosarcina sp. Marseille-Q4063]QUW23821.1 ABC transporter permease [Sporosarcina sp. Marseille-Q4063]
MQFKDQIDFVRQHISKNKLRVFMTVLAATMGTAFLIVLASVGFGIHDTITKEILSDRKVTEIQVHASEMSQELANEFKTIDHVNAVVNRQEFNGQTETIFKNMTGHNGVIATDFIEEGKVGFKLAEGRLPENPNEVVVGSHFGQFLLTEEEANGEVEVEEGEEGFKGYEGKLIGEQFTVRLGDFDGKMFEKDELKLTIVGVATPPARDWFTDQNIYTNASLIPTINQIYTANSEVELDDHPDAMHLFYNNVMVYADNLENVKAITKTLKDQGHSVYSVTEELDQLDVFFFALKAGLIFVGTIAILISSIGIFNTMTMAVTERTREIGVMKAIGANPKLIQRLFLMESAWIGILGTFLAIVISYGVSIIANFVLPIIVTAALGEEDFGDMQVKFSIIPWQLVVIASTISIGVAMISGWRPARKATKIDVINALRTEL